MLGTSGPCGTGRVGRCSRPLLGLQLGAGDITHVPLVAGDRVVLMTDGLVERRDTSLDATMDLLAADVAGTRDVAAETLADRIIDRWGHGEDDVALLIVDLEPPA